MVCLKCDNQKNFIIFRGEVVYVNNARISRVEKSQTRAMCNECFSTEVLIESTDFSREELAA